MGQRGSLEKLKNIEINENKIYSNVLGIANVGQRGIVKALEERKGKFSYQ